MSFNKKLESFLDSAVSGGIIDDNKKSALMDFASSAEDKKGMSLFITAVSFMGGIAVILGIILVIASNWHEIKDSVKIGSFIALMAVLHLSAFYLTEVKKDFYSTAASLHFIGAGMVLAGIGLYAQIYNLASTNGSAYLTWSLLTIPLAFALLNRAIGLMSLTGFLLWLNIYTFDAVAEEIRFVLTFLTLEAVSIYTFFLLFARPSWLKKLVSFVSYSTIYITLGILGFMHELSYADFSSTWREGSAFFLPVHIGLLVFVIAGTVHLIYKSLQDREEYRKTAVEAGVLAGAMSAFGLSYVTDNLAVISFASWVVWFVSAIAFVSLGARLKDNSMVNRGVFLFGLGLFLRFVDLVDTMLRTGVAFIMFGIVLMVTAYLLEKWRKRILTKMKEQG